MRLTDQAFRTVGGGDEGRLECTTIGEGVLEHLPPRD